MIHIFYNLPENQNSVFYKALFMLLLHTFLVVETHPSIDIVWATTTTYILCSKSIPISVETVYFVLESPYGAARHWKTGVHGMGPGWLQMGRGEG